MITGIEHLAQGYKLFVAEAMAEAREKSTEYLQGYVDGFWENAGIFEKWQIKHGLDFGPAKVYGYKKVLEEKLKHK